MVPGQTPLVELTQTTVGVNMTAQDIENLPTLSRDMLSLMQMVPGLTPASVSSGIREASTVRMAART